MEVAGRAAFRQLQGNSARARKLRTISPANASLWKERVLSGLSLVELGGLAAAVGTYLSPKGPGGCDHNRLERIANIFTSLPIFLVGIDASRNRQSKAGRMWGASIAGVGVSSVLFHSSTGRWRSVARKLDYWAIAISSNLLTKATFPQLPSAVTWAGIAATPFRPFFVSFANTTAMELQYLARAVEEPSLRKPQLHHSACALAGMTIFSVEDCACAKGVPLLHSAWHCLSAACLHSTNVLLKDSEERQQRRNQHQHHHQHGSGSGRCLADVAAPLQL